MAQCPACDGKISFLKILDQKSGTANFVCPQCHCLLKVVFNPRIYFTILLPYSIFSVVAMWVGIHSNLSISTRALVGLGLFLGLLIIFFKSDLFSLKRKDNG